IYPFEFIIQIVTLKGTFAVVWINSEQLGSSIAVNCGDLPEARVIPAGARRADRTVVNSADTKTGSITDIEGKPTVRELISAALEELKVAKNFQLATQEINVMNSGVYGVHVEAALVRIKNLGVLRNVVPHHRVKRIPRGDIVSNAAEVGNQQLAKT